MNNKEIRVRFAPSPTGHLHVGGARQAIFNWLVAKSMGGKFLLRIEDTDKERSKVEFSDSIIKAMTWLGITIDEEVVVQSDNQSHHNQVALDLIKKDLAYKCYCSIDELNELRENSEAINFKYPGTCRSLDKNVEVNKSFVVRFKLPKLSRYQTFVDCIKGEITVESHIFDDFVILKNDSVPTYNFAVVLDDISMRISHVLRGEEHIINTFRQKFLYDSLGIEAPTFGHTPMILGPNGEKLSKRHGATAVIDYKLMGVLPEALFNYLVRLGWSHGDQEVFSKEELCKLFSIDAIGTKNGIFDINKLMWLNGVYLKKLTLDEFFSHLDGIDFVDKEFIEQSASKDKLEKLLELYKPRATNLIELLSQVKTCLLTSRSISEESFKSLSEDTKKLLAVFLTQAVNLEVFSSQTLMALAKQITSEVGKTIPELAKPLRFILSGYEEGASAFGLCEIFGTSKLNLILNFLMKV